jgi:hypothetical protein
MAPGGTSVGSTPICASAPAAGERRRRSGLGHPGDCCRGASRPRRAAILSGRRRSRISIGGLRRLLRGAAMSARRRPRCCVASIPCDRHHVRAARCALTADERAGMAWWNGLTEAGAYWLRVANTAIPAEAWAAYKRTRIHDPDER